MGDDLERAVEFGRNRDEGVTSMATIVPPTVDSTAEAQPSLYDGQQLLQPEFHRRYEAIPEDQKYELIDGVVYMAAAQRRPHSRSEPLLSMLLVMYEAATLGVEVLHNATTIMDKKNEPQPDLQLRVLSHFGGRTVITPERYVCGPPELVIEVSDSTLRVDLSKKLTMFQKQGVKEYLVVDVEASKIHWFVWPEGERVVEADGILRSVTFPGLWIDSQALFEERIVDLQAVLNEGLKQPEHAAFVATLQRNIQKQDPK